MKESNVTLIFDGVGGGLPPMEITDKQIIAYLLYRPDTDEFLYSQKMDDGFFLHVYTKEPFFAHYFKTEQQAAKAAQFIEYETFTVPLFDFGDKFAVAFPDDLES